MPFIVRHNDETSYALVELPPIMFHANLVRDDLAFAVGHSPTRLAPYNLEHLQQCMLELDASHRPPSSRQRRWLLLTAPGRNFEECSRTYPR